jgi:iron complex outermembrane receptor protein
MGRNGEYAGYSTSALIGTKHDKWYAQASFARNFTDRWDLPGSFTGTANQAAGRRDFSRSADWRVNVKAGFTPTALMNMPSAIHGRKARRARRCTLVIQSRSSAFELARVEHRQPLFPVHHGSGRFGHAQDPPLPQHLLQPAARLRQSKREHPDAGPRFNSPYWDEALGGSRN